MKNLLAAEIKIAPGGLQGIGPLGLEGKSAEWAPIVFTRFLSTLIGVMTIIGFIWFIIQLFIGAVSMIGAGGDKAKVEQAKSKITNSLIGLVVVIAAVFIIQIVGSVFGIDVLNLIDLLLRVGEVQG